MSPIVALAAGAAEEPGAASRSLSFEFDQVPAGAVFRALETRAGIVIEAPAPLRHRAVSIRLENATLDTALRQVFRALSVNAHAVLSDEEGSRTFLVLGADAHSRSRTTRSPSRSVREEAPGRGPEALAIEEERAAGDPGYVRSDVLLARLVSVPGATDPAGSPKASNSYGEYEALFRPGLEPGL